MQQNNATITDRQILEGVGCSIDWFSAKNERFIRLVSIHMSDAQRVTLIKCAKFGWKLSKIVYRRQGTGCAIAMYSNGTAAWLLPDGTIDRAAAGKKTAYLSNDWVEML